MLRDGAISIAHTMQSVLEIAKSVRGHPIDKTAWSD